MVHFQSKVVFQLSAGYIAYNKFLQMVTLDSTEDFEIHYVYFLFEDFYRKLVYLQYIAAFGSLFLFEDN
jgi:hypothetical protein